MHLKPEKTSFESLSLLLNIKPQELMLPIVKDGTAIIQSTCSLGHEKYMTDCPFVQDEPPANSST